jgi:hypothetical protein
LINLYGDQYDFFFYLEVLLYGLAEAWMARPSELKPFQLAVLKT